MNLLKSSTKRNIIQATKNNIVLENFAEYENQENVKYFYLALNRKLGLELGNVLGSLYPTSEVKSMKDMGWPFLTTIKNISLTGKIIFLSFPSPLYFLRPVSKYTPSASARTWGQSDAFCSYPILCLWIRHEGCRKILCPIHLPSLLCLHPHLAPGSALLQTSAGPRDHRVQGRHRGRADALHRPQHRKVSYCNSRAGKI